MTHSIRVLLFLGLVTAVFTNCKKDSNDFEGLRVKIDGSLWTAPTATGAAAGDNITITGADPTTFKSVTIVVPSNISVGTHTIETFGDIQCTYSLGLSSAFLSDSGKIVISENDSAGKRIKGTFEFQATNLLGSGSASLTEGEFNVTY